MMRDSNAHNAQPLGLVFALRRWPPLAAYAAALLLTLATIYLRDSIAVSFGDRPLLILFMFPILLSALLGGMGSGLLATFISAAYVDYFLIPPANSFRIEHGYDALQWFMMIANGFLVSVISEYLYRSRQVATRNKHELTDTRTLLRQSDTRFETIFDQAAIGIALVSTDGRWLRVNHKLCDIFGYSQDELLKIKFQDITHPDDLKSNLEYVRRTLAREIPNFFTEKRYLRKDGSIVWTNLSVALATKADGTPDYFIAAIEDIQARKQAEQALADTQATMLEARDRARLAALNQAEDAVAAQQSAIKANAALAESEQRLSGIINSAMDAVISVDEQQRIQLFNPAAGLMFGLNPAEVIGQPLGRIIPQRFRRSHEEHIRNFAQTGMTMRRMGELGEISGLRANGEEFPIEASISQITIAGDKLFTVILRDVTERHQAEQEIRRLNADLERRVAERTVELTAANLELDSFAYAVSHDLRAPLRAMSGFSHALDEDYGKLLQGEAHDFLDQINLASIKMSELIDGLLSLSRSTRGELRYEKIDITAMSERLLSELAKNDPERMVATEVAAGLEAHGDARMFEVVMRNLLGNAWKYSAHTSAPSICVYKEALDGSCRFCVADNGAGFDMVHADRLFRPFQRLHRQEEFPGIGIGLATVQRILHRHGGNIEARGEPGKGAVFCFTLPDSPHESVSIKLS